MAQTNGTSDMDSGNDSAILKEILTGLKSLQQENSHLAAAVDAINGRVNMLAGVKQMQDAAHADTVTDNKTKSLEPIVNGAQSDTPSAMDLSTSPPPGQGRRSSVTSKIILTSYPGQAGVDPLPMDWGNKNPDLRGPVVVSRNPSTIRRRNGKHSVLGKSDMLTDFSQRSVPMEDHTLFIMLLLSRAKTSILIISLISPTQSQL